MTYREFCDSLGVEEAKQEYAEYYEGFNEGSAL